MITYYVRSYSYWSATKHKYIWNYRSSKLKCKILFETNHTQELKYKPGPFKDSENNLRFLGRENVKRWHGKSRMVRRARGLRTDARWVGRRFS